MVAVYVPEVLEFEDLGVLHGVRLAIGILNGPVGIVPGLLPADILGEGALLVAAGVVGGNDAQSQGLVVPDFASLHDVEVGCYGVDEE